MTRSERESRRDLAIGVVATGVVLAIQLPLFGCTASLDAPTLVKTPRIFEVSVDPPESAPGTDLTVSVLGHDPARAPDAISYRFFACADLGHALDAAGITSAYTSAPCTELEAEGDHATVPGSLTTTLAASLAAVPDTGGFSAEVLEQILATSGIPFELRVELVDEDGIALVTASKLAAITTRTDPPPTTNPPAVAFSIGDVDVVMPEELTELDCTATSELTFAPSTDVVINPIPGYDWTEDYLVYDYTGVVRTGHESEYYSFYSDGGSLADETTRPPDRQTTFTTPDEPGDYRLWFIVRDGHLGARGCRVNYRVE